MAIPFFTRLLRLASSRFRVKIILVAIVIVCISLVLSSAIALRNLTRLGTNASDKIESGLATANTEYLENYIETTALRTHLLLDRAFSELRILGDMLQTLLDHPEENDRIGELVSTLPSFQDRLSYNPKGNWWQNGPPGGPKEPSVVSVWGHLLEGGRIKPEVQRLIRDTTLLDVVLPAIKNHGSSKLYMYVVGPRGKSYLRLSPYVDMASEFDKNYPGHNKQDFWDFFFPGLVESVEKWPAAGMTRAQLADAVVITAPYEDAAGGGIIVSAFHPLWEKDQPRFAGAAAMDFSLSQIVDLIKDVKLAKTGFAFFAQSQGNVLAVHETGEKILGVSKKTKGAGTSGVSLLARNLKQSTQEGIRTLAFPLDSRVHLQRVKLTPPGGGSLRTYIIVTKRMKPIPSYDKPKVKNEAWTLGFVVPEDEVYEVLFATQKSLKETERRTLYSQILVAIVSLCVVLLGVFWFSKQMTSGLTSLSSAAKKISGKDYSVRVQIDSHDEIGQLGKAFNVMADEIAAYTGNLEKLVSERTQELAKANEEIVALNRLLKAENLRLGAEIAVAQRLQLMVLPKKEELKAIHGLDVAGYLRPADDVAGDYYDVLQSSQLVKIGIGDVTGHGLSSGVLMLMVQSITRTLLDAGEYDPVRFLTLLNQVLYKNIQRIDTDKNLTLSFIDFQDGRAVLSGQHEEVLLARRSGTLERINTMDLGFPVGLQPDISPFVSTQTVELEPGDVITLFTDGITEAEDPSGKQFGIERLCESLKRRRSLCAQEISDGIVSDLTAYIGKQKVYDDFTLVVLKRV